MASTVVQQSNVNRLSGVDQAAATRMSSDRCTCCPYGYHIDLDFLRFLDSLYSGESLRNIRRVRQPRVTQSHASYDGFFSDDEVTRWRHYVGSSAHSPLSPPSGASGGSVGHVTTDEILLEIDTSMSRTLNSIDEVDTRVVRKKKPPRPLPDKSRLVASEPRLQEAVNELVTAQTTTLTSTELTSHATDLASSQQSAGDISPGALQVIRDQLVVSLQRMRQLEDQVRVIPTMEQEINDLRQENARLRQLMLQTNEINSHLSAEDESVKTFRSLSGSIMVELPVSVGNRELRSIGVGDNDVFGRFDKCSIIQESSHVSRETLTQIHKSNAEARREFLFGSGELDPSHSTSGWVSRLPVKAVCSTGTGDGNVLEYEKMQDAGMNFTVNESQLTRVNLQVTVSEERNLSEPRWEVERFGRDVAVQCLIIGGALSTSWYRSSGTGFCRSPLCDDSQNEEFVSEPAVAAVSVDRVAANVWDGKLAQLLKAEFSKREEDVIKEEKAVSVQTGPSAFDWNSALNKLDEKKIESPVEVNGETESTVEWDNRVQTITIDNHEQDDMQPFPPYLSPIKASSIDELDRQSLSTDLNDVKVTVEEVKSIELLSDLEPVSCLSQDDSPPKHNVSAIESDIELEESLLHHNESVKESDIELDESLVQHNKSVKESDIELDESLLQHNKSVKESDTELDESLVQHNKSVKESDTELDELLFQHNESVKESDIELDESLVQHNVSVKESSIDAEAILNQSITEAAHESLMLVKDSVADSQMGSICRSADSIHLLAESSASMKPIIDSSTHNELIPESSTVNKPIPESLASIDYITGSLTCNDLIMESSDVNEPIPDSSASNLTQQISTSVTVEFIETVVGEVIENSESHQQPVEHVMAAEHQDVVVKTENQVSFEIDNAASSVLCEYNDSNSLKFIVAYGLSEESVDSSHDQIERVDNSSHQSKIPCKIDISPLITTEVDIVNDYDSSYSLEYNANNIATNVSEIECFITSNVTEIECRDTTSVATLECVNTTNVTEIESRDTTNVATLECVNTTNVTEIECRDTTSVAMLECVNTTNVTEIECHDTTNLATLECVNTTNVTEIECFNTTNVSETECSNTSSVSEVEHFNSSCLAETETVSKGCRIIITETRIDRQLIGSQDDQSQVVCDTGTNELQQADLTECQAVSSEAHVKETSFMSDHEDQAVKSKTVHFNDNSFQQWPEISEEMLTACSVYAQWLVDSSKVTLDEKKCNVEIIQKCWFQTAGRKSSTVQEVRLYLAAFERIHLPLLFAVVNMADNDMNTVLHYAVSHGNIGIIEILLDTGVCDIRRQNRAGYTPVMLAALLIIDTHQHRDVIKRLFCIGDVNVQSSTSGQTALMLAASHGRLEMLDLLLECGADVNARDNDGSTALMCACEHGYMDIVQTLLVHPQCDSTLTDVDGSTALSIAMDEGYRDIGVLLYAHMNTGRQASPFEAEPDDSLSSA